MPDPSLQEFRNLIKTFETSLEELHLDHANHHVEFVEKYRTLTRYLRTVRDKAIRPLLKDRENDSELVHEPTAGSRKSVPSNPPHSRV